jgi:hypothetical protein
MNAAGRDDLVPYREVSALDVDPQFEYFEHGRTLRWRCAQCKHDCEHDLRPGWMFGASVNDIAGVDLEVIVECSCGHPHHDEVGPDEPHDGCGCFFKHG